MSEADDSLRPGLPLIDEKQLRAALLRLGELMAEQGEHLELQIVGGAVMVMEFHSRQSTRDVDIVSASVSRETLTTWTRRVAVEHGLPEDWLSDGAARYAVRPSDGPELLKAPGIRVSRASTEQLLAMKLWAMRDDVDRADAILLARELGLDRSSTELAIAPYLPKDRYPEACEELVDLWEEVDNGSN